MREDIARLADEVEDAKGFDNALDIRCEIALFEPNEVETAIRSNFAGTKVVLTIAGVGDRSFLARDYTISAGARRKTAAALRHLLARENGGAK